MSAGLPWRQRLRAWARRHSYSLFSSLGSLVQNRAGTLMTVLVLGIAMFLPLALYVTLTNLDRVELREERWSALTVFMAEDVGEQQARALVERLQGNPDVAAVELISPDEGLAEFQAASGFGESLQLLESNPLPWVLSVTPAQVKGVDLDASAVRLGEEVQKQAGVASVSYDYKWLQRLARLLEFGRAAVGVLMLLFGLTVVVVVANTIRLDVAARTDEIEILALVGAGSSFIRQPFLYSGYWYGVLGGVVAMVLINAVLVYMEGPLQRLLESYGQQQSLLGLGGLQTLGLLAGAGVLGWLGALIAVQRHLRTLRVGGTLGRR